MSPESPLDKMQHEVLSKIDHDLRVSAVATLAASVVGAAGRPVSVKEVLEIQQDIYFSLYSGEVAAHGHYQAWAKTKDARVSKTWS
jgi:hypothetical protein